MRRHSRSLFSYNPYVNKCMNKVLWTNKDICSLMDMIPGIDYSNYDAQVVYYFFKELTFTKQFSIFAFTTLGQRSSHFWSSPLTVTPKCEDFLEGFTQSWEIKVLRCRNISVSHSLSQDELEDLVSPFSSLVDHPLWIVVVVEYFAEVIYFLG